MPGPEQVIRAAVVLPFRVARRVVGFAAGLLPGDGTGDAADERGPEPDVDPREAAADALRRERDPVEEPAFEPAAAAAPEEHVEAEVELVAESADLEATEPPGPQLRVDEPWDGYRRMRVAEIVTRLEGQPPEVFAAVELYEATHRNRRGVLEAVRTAARG